MQIRYLSDREAYDGSQLRAHWILRRAGLVGDAAVAFRGPCAVSEDEMADLADLLEGPGIKGHDMVHVVVELFDDGNLDRAIARQRMLSVVAGEILCQLSPAAADLRRDGDDLYLGEAKLSISIATRSLVSTLMHFAVNVSNAGTPVTTACLEDLSVAPEEFAEQLLNRFAREMESMRLARAKVRAKGESAG